MKKKVIIKRKVVKKRKPIIMNTTATVTISTVTPPTQATFTFVVTVSNGDSATFTQQASDQNTAIDQFVAELSTISAAATSQKV